jgi:hypothetical protein
MEFKVRALDGNEQKGVAEIEQELLEKHEAKLDSEQNNEPVIENEPVNEVIEEEEELSEEKVLSYIGKRYNKQINSFDELVSERKDSEPLPEDVSAYLKYKKETGRGFEDFLKLNKDYNSIDDYSLLKDYLSATQNGLDEEDIETLMDDYRFDEDVDDDSTIKKIKITRKKAVAEAKKFFNEQKEKYKIPLESRGLSVSESEIQELEAYRQYINQSKTIEEENERKRNWFSKKTEELFSDGFKGFEFSINDKTFSFTPGDANELKKSHSNPANFINKFLDDNGLIKDSVGYHKSLAIAMNPDKFAKYFYEQGIADATDDVMRKTKNINMSERKMPEVAKINGGVQVKSVNPDSGRKLKIRSIKKL